MSGSEPEPVIFDTDSAVFDDVRAAPSPGEGHAEADAQF
jgi:hypothetical protein